MNDFHNDIRGRRSIRIKGYDYGRDGAYFVTVCTKEKRHLFGRIVGSKMYCSSLGRVVENCWLQIPIHFPFVELGEWIVMPNHVHGVLIFDKKSRRDAKSCVHPFGEGEISNLFGPQSQNLASIVRGFKVGVTKYARKYTDVYEVWQSRFYDRVIRDECELFFISEYIESNPKNWGKDRFYNY